MVRDYGALRNYIKKYSIRTRNVRKGGAPSIKKQEEVIGICSKYILNIFRTSY